MNPRRFPSVFISCLSLCIILLLIDANLNPVTNLKTKPEKFLAANWKCNLQNPNSIDDLVDDLNTMYSSLTQHHTSTVKICVNPPHVFLDRVRRRLHDDIAVGAQNLYDATGPNSDNTGTVTPTALSALGVSHVLLGHSDRRNGLGETDRLIADKVRLALENGLGVILTIGELKYQRRFGLALRTLRKQLAAAAKAVPSDSGGGDWDKIVLAYEPVWSVGEGATPCSPSEAQRVNAYLRKWIRKNVGEKAAESVKLTYTGSVNEGNAESYAGLEDVDGFVVGRAGLDAERLGQIVRTLASSVVEKQ